MLSNTSNIYLSMYMLYHISIFLSITYLSCMNLFISMSICLSVHSSIYLSSNLSIYMYVCLFVYLSIYHLLSLSLSLINDLFYLSIQLVKDCFHLSKQANFFSLFSKNLTVHTIWEWYIFFYKCFHVISAFFLYPFLANEKFVVVSFLCW